jgi:hypothetical protein
MVIYSILAPYHCPSKGAIKAEAWELIRKTKMYFHVLAKYRQKSFTTYYSPVNTTNVKSTYRKDK